MLLKVLFVAVVACIVPGALASELRNIRSVISVEELTGEHVGCGVSQAEIRRSTWLPLTAYTLMRSAEWTHPRAILFSRIRTLAVPPHTCVHHVVLELSYVVRATVPERSDSDGMESVRAVLWSTWSMMATEPTDPKPLYAAVERQARRFAEEWQKQNPR